MRIEVDAPPSDSSDVRGPLNEVITVINLAASATEEIEGLVRHVDGIIKQASSSEIPPNRLSALQKEAEAAVRALGERGFSGSAPTVTGSLDESVRHEIEATLGRTLEFLLPERVRSDFDLGRIDFSTKEAIVQTQTSIAVAQKRIEQIKGEISDSHSTLSRIVAAEEVAAENRRAAGASVRDLDRASSLAVETEAGIRGNRDVALGSFAKLGERALKVLGS